MINLWKPFAYCRGLFYNIAVNGKECVLQIAKKLMSGGHYSSGMIVVVLYCGFVAGVTALMFLAWSAAVMVAYNWVIPDVFPLLVERSVLSEKLSLTASTKLSFLVLLLSIGFPFMRYVLGEVVKYFNAVD